jgi:hypothetical protein
MRIDESGLPPGWSEGLEIERDADGEIRRISAERGPSAAVLEVGEDGTVFRETRTFRWTPEQGTEEGLELLRRSLAGFGCSFCGRPQEEVGSLITGNTANICDACVEMCTEILDGAEAMEVEVEVGSPEEPEA